MRRRLHAACDSGPGTGIRMAAMNVDAIPRDCLPALPRTMPTVERHVHQEDSVEPEPVFRLACARVAPMRASACPERPGGAARP